MAKAAVEKEPGCTLVIANPATHSNTTGQDPDYVNSTANPLYDLLDKDDSVFHEYVNVDICVQNSNEVIYDNLINRADEHIYENTVINRENTNNESVAGAGEDENEITVEVHVEQHGDESSTDLPELTPTHLVNVFLNSDITVGTLNALRVMLQVSRARLLSVAGGDNNLAMQAMEVISAWVDEHPEISLQEKHRILADHLRSLELSYLIPKLRGEERIIGADPQAITNYLRDVTRTFSTSQAREFGRSLKLSKKKIETISRSTGATTGMELVLQIFDHVNRNNTHLNGPLMSEIEESLYAAAKLNTNPTRGTLRKYHNRLGCCTTRVNSAESETKTNKKKVLCSTTLAVSILLVNLIILCSILFLVIYPQAISLPKQVILPTDVVLYIIPSSYWLASINIELEGAAGCSAQVISAECNDLQYYNTSDISYINEFDYLYITKDSSVEFVLSSKTSPSYYAWIFNDVQLAMQHSANNFEDLACNHPPEGAWCIKLGNNEHFVAPYSSYYFIRCDRGPNCTGINSIEVNTREYDFESTQTHEINSVTIYTHGEDETIKLKKETFNPFPVENEICLLMTLDENDCQMKATSNYQVAITRRGGRYELLLYLGLILLLSLIISIVALKCYSRKYELNHC